MRKVEKYESDDGYFFNTEKECREHELKVLWVSIIYDELRHADADDIFKWVLKNTKGFNDLKASQ